MSQLFCSKRKIKQTLPSFVISHTQRGLLSNVEDSDKADRRDLRLLLFLHDFTVSAVLSSLRLFFLPSDVSNDVPIQCLSLSLSLSLSLPHNEWPLTNDVRAAAALLSPTPLPPRRPLLACRQAGAAAHYIIECHCTVAEPPAPCMYRVTMVVRDYCCSTICPILLGLVRLGQKWQISWTRLKIFKNKVNKM